MRHCPHSGGGPSQPRGSGDKRGSSSWRESWTQPSLALFHLRACGPSGRSHHGAAASHLLQELQQGQILISGKILQCILRGQQRGHGGLVPTTATGLISHQDYKPQGSRQPLRSVPSALLTLLSTGMFASEPRNPKATGKKLLYRNRSLGYALCQDFTAGSRRGSARG